MLLALIFIGTFIFLAGWNAVIAWYLKRYIMQDDQVHHKMYVAFLCGNGFFILLITIFLIRTPWSGATELLTQSLKQQLERASSGFDLVR